MKILTPSAVVPVAESKATRAAALTLAETLLGALRDAAEWRRYRATTWCAECSWAPDNVCAGCAGDLDLADSYAALGRALGDDR